jgi:hypothetical protein
MGWREVFNGTQDRKHRKNGKDDDSGRENISDISEFSDERSGEDLNSRSDDSGTALSPELERLVVLVAKHYHCSRAEVEIMKQEAAKEPEAALTCFQNIAEREELLGPDRDEGRTR